MFAVATPGEKIQHVRLARRPRLTQAELASKIGITRSQLANIETGRTEPAEAVIRKLSRLWQVRSEWFWDNGSVEPAPSDAYAPGLPPPGSPPPEPSVRGITEARAGVGRRLIPVQGEAGAAEFPLASDGTVDSDLVVEFSDDIFRAERFAIKVRGDSMSPRVPHGTFALIQPDPNPPPGLLVAARNGSHEYVVKVLRFVKGVAELHPINPDYPVLRPEDGWTMIGYVVGLRQERGKRKYSEEGDNDGIRP